MLNKIKKLDKKRRQIFLNLVDEILFDRDVGEERIEYVMEFLVNANWTRDEIKTFLEF